MRGRAHWWTVAMVASFVACGGSSSRKRVGDGDDGSPDGGTAGSAGTNAGSGAAPPGGAVNTGGRGGGGRGGSTAGKGGGAQGGSGGVSGSDGGDTGFGGVGTGGDGGFGGTPVCDDPLPGKNTCWYEDACVVLGCGEAWSNYTTWLCRRDECASTGTCAAGERCLLGPVAGRFDDPCSNEVDSCEEVDSVCECQGYEECAPSAVCVPESEFPPRNDCPIADLDCAELERAASTVQAYLDVDVDVFTVPYDVPVALVGGLQACAAAIAGRLEAECD